MRDKVPDGKRGAVPLPGITHLDLGCEYRGGQRQVIYLAVEQLAAGLQVCVAAPEGSPILAAALEHDVPTVSLPRKRDFHPCNLFELLRLLPRSPHILHTHDARSASLGAMARLFRPALNLVHTRRVSYALGQGWSRWKYGLGSLVVCVSREVEETVRNAGIARTMVIHSAIALKRYAPRAAGNAGRMGLIGALSPQKGHEQFFHALSLLGDMPEIWVVGDGALQADLKLLAERLGIARRVVWKGWVESPLVWPSLDVLVVPSVHGEGSSGVIKEGWACGVPVICSDLPANLELVRDGVNGLVFANNDPASLARQINRLREEAGLAGRLVAAGLSAVTQYDVSRMHAAYLQAYAFSLPS